MPYECPLQCLIEVAWQLKGNGGRRGLEDTGLSRETWGWEFEPDSTGMDDSIHLIGFNEAGCQFERTQPKGVSPAKRATRSNQAIGGCKNSALVGQAPGVGNRTEERRPDLPPKPLRTKACSNGGHSHFLLLDRKPGRLVSQGGHEGGHACGGAGQEVMGILNPQ